MANRVKADRAKIFLPFAGLKGFKEALREKEKITVAKKILSQPALFLLWPAISTILVQTSVDENCFADNPSITVQNLSSLISRNKRHQSDNFHSVLLYLQSRY